ncbi:MAG: 50S ribosomal protein L23 [Helicobacteraceae bacterium]|jgi:large subunit ribosomal protein L23|nr:50S ribosomal protein L23 [Helicobacteraceae bacterium]
MADITDIKSILYTEKTLGLQERGVVVVQTSPKITKNSLKELFRVYFGVLPKKINSTSVRGKTKRFRGVVGKRNDLKKFFVTLPEGAAIEALTA